jgi:prepilin-type N-terminal cleavage/methylation domain-containing protein
MKRNLSKSFCFKKDFFTRDFFTRDFFTRDFFTRDNKKGVSLIELVLVMGIVAVLLVFATNVVGIFIKAGTKGVALYRAQTDARRSVTVVSDALRNAGSIYLLPKKFFNAQRNKNLPKSFNYIGTETLSDGRTQLVKYVLSPDGEYHIKSVIAEADNERSFKLALDKAENEAEKLIGLKVACEANGIAPQELSALFRAFNAGFVVDWSAGADAVAVAYAPERAEISVTRKEAQKGGAAIYMVLDNSGSMSLSMNSDSETNNISNWRAYHLRAAGKKFVDRISAYERVFLGVQGFDSTAPKASHKVLMDLSKPETQKFYADLFDAKYFLTNYRKFTTESARYSEILHAVGGTNMGDGFRKAYRNILAETASLGIRDYNKYMTFISDGEPTAYTVLSGAPNNTNNISAYFYYGDLEAPTREYWVKPPSIFTNFGYEYQNGLKTCYIDRDERPANYANAVAKMIADSREFKDFFFVAIGELRLDTIKKIASSFGVQKSDFPSHVFKASDEMNFYMAIESIAESISVEIEKVLGAELLEGVEDW